MLLAFLRHGGSLPAGPGRAGGVCFRQRPYSVEYTRSHPNSEVKLQKARAVLGWGTAWEALRVLLAFCFSGAVVVSSADQGRAGGVCFRQRPYSVEYTRSHPNSEVKLQKARSVLGWGTAWEALRVLLAFCVCLAKFHASCVIQTGVSGGG